MAMLNSASSEDKKKQLQKWFSDEELERLAGMAVEKELVKTDNVHPDLYSQMYYAMQDVADAKASILTVIDSLHSALGFKFLAEMILDGIPLSVANELCVADTMSSTEDELYLSAEGRMGLYNSVYAHIEAVKVFLEIGRLEDRIARKTDLIELAENKVLI